jgi:hypothetical protein
MKRLLKLMCGLVIGAWLAPGATIFPQCPPVGVDTNGCELLITVTAVSGTGAATAFTVALASPDQGPYDGVEDTLLGIVNNAGAPLKSIFFSAIVAGVGIFDFDGDGACATIGCVNGAGDTSGYGGPGVFFSGIGGTLNSSGTVNFSGAGIAVNGSAWFTLEGPLTAQTLTGSPEPGTFGLLGLTTLALATKLRRRRESSKRS